MIDSHAHVMFDAFDEDRDAVFARAREAGVSGWVEVGTDIEQSQQAISLAQHHESVWATVGVHPSDVADLSKESWQEFEQLLQQPRVVAVGEVGLDFYRGGTLDKQLPALERFIALAQTRHLPIVFHVRDGEQNAHDALIAHLQSLPDDERPRGVIHTYSGTREQAEAYLELGLYLSFSGVVTFKNAQETLEVAKAVPLERILIETDCPFLTPDPYRGKRNEPAYVRLVAEKIAAVRGLALSNLDTATEQNTHTLFAMV